MERINRSLKGRYWRKVITYLLMCCVFLNTSLPIALAEVALDEIIRGDITVVPDPVIPDKTNMTASDGAIGHFSDFDIASGHFVDCVQPSTDASALFRIFSEDGTNILGRFDATGHIYLVDPAGIVFGGGSQINVTRLVASGLNMSNDAFDAVLAGGEMEFAGGEGNVTSRAQIIADSVYLVGKKVFNNGVIQAPNGLVVMAAGDEVRLAQDGSNVSVVVSGLGDGDPDIRNSSIVSADNGKIVLAAGDTFSRAISNVSYLAASNGEVSIQAAQVENNGVISVSNNDGGDGGSVTIQADELFQMGETSAIMATGDGESGNGGSVTITCDDFEIAGEIDASPENKINEPGKLEINTPNVIIADSDDPFLENTLYEDDIEALSQAGTSLIVNAEEGITVKDIKDVIGDGEITGQFGSIELHATGETSAVTFAQDTDTIRTSLGDIVIEAGSGGIDVGNLITGKDLADEKPAPGQIFLTTTNGGDIETGDLIIEDGWGHAEINVKSDGNLTVDGDVKVGLLSDILNAPPEASAEAMVYLKASENVVLNGEVCADAHGIDEAEDTTKAYIEIFAGGNANINGDLYAEAKVSNNGTADAVIKVEAVGDIVFAEGVDAHAIADETEVQGTESQEETSPDGDHAQIIVNANATPPVIGVPSEFSTLKREVLPVDVLANDTQGGEPLEGGTINSYTNPVTVTGDPPTEVEAGSLTEVTEIINEEEKIVSFVYNPPEDLSVLEFDENGEATVTFTYVAEANGELSEETPVTITLVNGLPVAVEDFPTTSKDQPVTFDVLINDTDPDIDDVLTAMKVGDIPTMNGTLVQNEDGTFTYTPNEGFFGDDSFMYVATDSFNASSVVEVKITVSERPGAAMLAYIQAAPGLDKIAGVDEEGTKVKTSGCPALVKWTADEVGIDQRLVQIWVSTSLASTGNIHPCEACGELRNAAKILQDADGTHIAALATVVNEFASSSAPPTEEQMASIADAIARNTDEDSHYAIADEYLDALATYVGTLSSEMGFSSVESVQLVTDKYVGRLAQSQNVGVATFIAASLAALGE